MLFEIYHFNPYLEYRDGTSISAGTPTYYIFAGGQRIASYEDTDGDGTKEYYYYHQDHLGGTALVTDDTGTVSQLYDYYPYGSELLNSQPTSGNAPAEHSFTDKELDDDLGLYYFEARWYDSEIGRFSSQDPAQFDGRIAQLIQDPQSLNFYAYSRNNPVNFVDPDGELAIAIPLCWAFCPILTTIIEVTVVATVGAIVGNWIGNTIETIFTDSGTNTTIPSTQETNITTTISPSGSTSNGTNYDSRAYGDIRDWVIGAGNNPNAHPEGYEWHGKGTPESGEGAWYNPETKTSLHPDVDHADPKGAHWDYREEGKSVSIDYDGNIIDDDGKILDGYQEE